MRMLQINILVVISIFLTSTPYTFAGGLSIFNNPFQYSSAYTDKENQLQYLNARFYRPEAMRFISRDTFNLLNRYNYADGNPIINSDPSGHVSAYAVAVSSGGLLYPLLTCLLTKPVNKPFIFADGLAMGFSLTPFALAVTSLYFVSQDDDDKSNALATATLVTGTLVIALSIRNSFITRYDDLGYADGSGFDRAGFNREGFNRDNFDRQGFDRDGFNREGFDRTGFNREGFNREGLDRQGLPRILNQAGIIAPDARAPFNINNMHMHSEIKNF